MTGARGTCHNLGALGQGEDPPPRFLLELEPLEWLRALQELLVRGAPGDCCRLPRRALQALLPCRVPAAEAWRDSPPRVLLRAGARCRLA